MQIMNIYLPSSEISATKVQMEYKTPTEPSLLYEGVDKGDGIRILVDRLWPSGVSKEEAKLDNWLKEMGPLSELRKWFNHDENKFADFKEKYKIELKKDEQQEAVKMLKKIMNGTDKTITLLYGANG